MLRAMLGVLRAICCRVWNFVADSNRLLVLATWAGVAVSIALVRDTRDSLARSQRAWIAPVYMKFSNPLTEGAKKIQVQVLYQDTGKEPGIGIKTRENGGALLLPSTPFEWEKLPIAANTTCAHLMPTRGRTVVYPSATFAAIETYDIRVKDSSGQDITPAELDAILKARATIYVNGCFAYITGNERHESAFCFYLAPDRHTPPSAWPFKSCATGNWAN